MFRLIKDISTLVRAANDIAASDPGDAPRWSLFITNRSFIAMAIVVLLNVAALLGVPLAGWLGQIAPDAIAGQVVQIATTALLLYGWAQRKFGKTRAVWSRKQAEKAVEEAIAITEAPQAQRKADALSEALTAAGAPAVKP